MSTDKKKAIGYIRVSTQNQVDSGLSLSDQRQKIMQYADLNDLQVTEIIEDAGLSAKNTAREGLQRMLTAARNKETQAIIIYKLDRLSRNVIDTLALIKLLEKEDIAFHSIAEKIDTKTATGKFFLTIIAALAEMERDLISERTIAALREKRRQNKLAGNIPYGWDLAEDKETLTENQKEQSVIKRIQQLSEKGLSLRKIISVLEKQGMKTKRGGKWQAQVVNTILKRKPF